MKSNIFFKFRFFFLFSIVYCLISNLFIAPVHAFDLLEFLFPSVQIQNTTTRSAPGPALAPEVPSNNTYSNTLEDNIVTCDGATTISRAWEPVKKDTGTTDANGHAIYEYVDYVASGNIEGEMDVKNLSNDFYRNFQLFFARGGIKCTEADAKADFTNFNAEGTSASLRAVPTAQIRYYRSQFLFEVAQSLNQSSPIDTVAQDYQIAWSCSGVCQELTSVSDNNSCRPVYVSEIIFGLKDEKIYYPSQDSDPTTFPSSITTNISAYYANNCSSAYGCYSSRSKGKSFSALSKDTYELIYRQLNFVPKGNANSKVTVVNYGSYNSSTQQFTNPTTTDFDRTLPNAAAATSNQAQALSFLNPTSQNNLSNSSLCNSVTTNSEIARDQPANATVSLYANNYSQAVEAGDSHTKEVNIGITTTYDAQVVINTQTAEKAYSNMIPVSILKENNLLDQSFSSTTTTNKNNPIPDPGYRADLLYQEMRSLLRPSSWL